MKKTASFLLPFAAACAAHGASINWKIGNINTPFGAGETYPLSVPNAANYRVMRYQNGPDIAYDGTIQTLVSEDNLTAPGAFARLFWGVSDTVNNNAYIDFSSGAILRDALLKDIADEAYRDGILGPTMDGSAQSIDSLVWNSKGPILTPPAGSQVTHTSMIDSGTEVELYFFSVIFAEVDGQQYYLITDLKHTEMPEGGLVTAPNATWDANGTQNMYNGLLLWYTVETVPEPGTATLLALGTAALALRRRRRA
ncbi:MAG: PEP-CTERM sorting domain-containing protein [Verrucomicrobiota bacterium]|jgi:hypothetical protein|nr:PEP-CTERM sorting domain-containing protein [Verrucomicrobiota bacterium]